MEHPEGGNDSEATNLAPRRTLQWPMGKINLLVSLGIFIVTYVYGTNDGLMASVASFRASSSAIENIGSAMAKIGGTANSEDPVSLGNTDSLTGLTIPAGPRARNAECGPCRLKVSSRKAALAQTDMAAIVIQTSTSFGRTGNFVMTVGEAIASARRCGYMLALPEIDGLKSFKFEEKYAVYDFVDDVEHRAPNHIRLPPTYCSDLLNMTGFALAKTLLAAAKLSPIDVEIDQCVRWYLGLCQPGFCGNLPEELKDTLVVHIRQGDIFTENYTNKVHGAYWQPPLDYYLAAMTFQTWNAIWVLSEPTDTRRSPLFHMLENLADRGLLPAPARFMQYVTGRTWADDLETLLCAPNVVTSRSSLEAVVRIGFSSQVFGLTCLRHTDGPAVSVYQIPTAGRNGEKYAPVLGHTNSPEEWVQILLHRLPQDVVKYCNTSKMKRL